MMKYLALFALAFSFACTCGPAIADDVIPLGNDGTSLAIHGNAAYTVILPVGKRLETRGDPIYSIDGVDVGHWPSNVVTYVLPNGVELTCRARGYNADTSEIEVWTPDVPLVLTILDVNKKTQRYSERVLTKFEEANRELRERGTVMTWVGEKWEIVRDIAAAPADVGFLVIEAPPTPPTVTSLPGR